MRYLVLLLIMSLGLISCGDQPTMQDVRPDLFVEEQVAAAPSFGTFLLVGHNEDDKGYYKVSIRKVNWPTFGQDRMAMSEKYDNVNLAQFLDQRRFFMYLLSVMRTNENNFLEKTIVISDPLDTLPDSVVLRNPHPDDLYKDFSFDYYDWEGKYYGVVFQGNAPREFPAPDGYTCKETEVEGRWNVNLYNGDTLVERDILGKRGRRIQFKGVNLRGYLKDPEGHVRDAIHYLKPREGGRFVGFQSTMDKVKDPFGILNGILSDTERVE